MSCTNGLSQFLKEEYPDLPGISRELFVHIVRASNNGTSLTAHEGCSDTKPLLEKGLIKIDKKTKKIELTSKTERTFQAKGFINKTN